MEIAGSTCTVCGEHVVLARDGKGCEACGSVVHQACDAQNTCSRCGAEYAAFVPPVANVLRDAIIPRSLRPSRSASPVAVIVFASLLLFFMILLMVVIFHH